MASAAGGTSQRLNPGFATVLDLSSHPEPGADTEIVIFFPPWEISAALDS